MSFLSIAFLVALPLVAAPILLHLFDRRRKVIIEWGAMQFLLEAATRKSSARRFQHWLLLLLRVLAIAAIVLALARPLVPGSWIGSSHQGETVIVIDNSMSTSQRSGNGVVFDELISQGEERIRELDPGSRVRVLVTSPYPAWVTPASLRVDLATRTQLVELLRNLRPNQGTSDLPAALLKAVQSDLEDHRITGRQVILLTDGQRKDWRTEDTVSWTRLQEALAGARVPTNLEIIGDDNPPNTTNLAVSRLRTNRTIVGINQPLSVTAEIRSHAAQPSKPCNVEWFVGDEKQSSNPLPVLQPGEAQDVVLQHSFTKLGVYSISCHVDAADDLKADDRESIVIEVVERVPVLLVEDSEGFAELQQDSYLLRAALGQAETGSANQWRAVFEPSIIPSQQIESIDLDRYKAVVIPNVTTLSQRACQRLTQFVTDGGGLWLALGPRTDVEAFRRFLFNNGDGLSPVDLSRIVDESSDALQRPTINPFTKKHPATAGLGDDQRLDTGDVKVSRRFRFQMPAETAAIPVLLDLSNGEPLALENHVGTGRVIVQAIPLRFQWSDLAASQAFVVMVHDWLGYLTEPRATRYNLQPGDPISLQHSRFTDDNTADDNFADVHATLTTPDGQDVSVSGEPVSDSVRFRTSRTALPGNYRLAIGIAGSGIPFHVARDDGESDLSRLRAGDRAFLKKFMQLDRPRALDSRSDSNLAPVWPALLMLLIALIAGELVLSGFIARKRFGSAPILETATQMSSEPSIAIGMTLGRKPSRRDQPEPMVQDEASV